MYFLLGNLFNLNLLPTNELNFIFKTLRVLSDYVIIFVMVNILCYIIYSKSSYYNDNVRKLYLISMLYNT